MVRHIFIAVLILFVPIFGMVNDSSAINYGAGTYNTCTYNTCGITLSSSGTVAINITPSGASTRCTVQSDSVTATTGSTTGYTVKINDSDTSTTLNGSGGNTIPSVSGTAASPVALTANKWGYRVDSIAGFGSGPAGALSSGSIPAYTFAAVPLSSAGGDTIRTTSTVDSGTVSTLVWYGACANASAVSGSYSDNITYTATVN